MLLVLNYISTKLTNIFIPLVFRWHDTQFHVSINCLHFVKAEGICRPLEYERVYLPLCKVADIPLYIQGDELEIFHFQKVLFNPYNAEIFLYKPREKMFFFQFETLISKA